MKVKKYQHEITAAVGWLSSAAGEATAQLYAQMRKTESILDCGELGRFL
jgi:hypothetical protein